VAAGATATFTVLATGDAPLAYKWRHNGADLPGQTASKLLLTNVQSANAGLYAVFVSNRAGSILSANAALTVNQAPVPVIEVSPLAPFAGWTNLIVIAPDNTNALVRFDGSKSYDGDDTNFLYFWFEGTNLLATTPVTTNVLAVGTHEVVLWLDDTLPYGTNSASVTVEVITPAQAVTILFSMLDNSNLSARSLRPLEATLGAALAAFELGRFTPAANQLTAFQNKVRAQVAPFDPALAEQLLAAAQSIIDALAWKIPAPQAATVTALSPQ
jgi:hypothetical protein